MWPRSKMECVKNTAQTMSSHGHFTSGAQCLLREGLCLCGHCTLLYLDPQDLLLPLGFVVEECLSSIVVMWLGHQYIYLWIPFTQDTFIVL